MRLYTPNATRDEYALLRGEKLDDYPIYPLRKYFIERDDKTILGIVWKFFFHVAETWPTQWSDPEGISILTKTTGYAAFMIVLRTWLLNSRSNQVIQVIRDEGVKEAFDEIKSLYESEQTRFLRTNYPAGGQGVIPLRDKLLSDLGLISN